MSPPFPLNHIENPQTQKSPKKEPKNTARLAKSGIEPDDMVGPVGYVPTNVVGTIAFPSELQIPKRSGSRVLLCLWTNGSPVAAISHSFVNVPINRITSGTVADTTSERKLLILPWPSRCSP